MEKGFKAYLETLVTGLQKRRRVFWRFLDSGIKLFSNSDLSLVRQDQDTTNSGLQMMMMKGLNEDVEDKDWDI